MKTSNKSKNKLFFVSIGIVLLLITAVYLFNKINSDSSAYNEKNSAIRQRLDFDFQGTIKEVEIINSIDGIVFLDNVKSEIQYYNGLEKHQVPFVLILENSEAELALQCSLYEIGDSISYISKEKCFNVYRNGKFHSKDSLYFIENRFNFYYEFFKKSKLLDELQVKDYLNTWQIQ